MAKEFFKNLPSQETPFNAQRWNGLLNGEEAMGSIVVEDIKCKNMFNKNGDLLAFNGVWGLALSNFINSSLLGKTITISINIVSPLMCFGSNETTNRIIAVNNTNKLTFEVTQEFLDLSNERYLFFKDINGNYVSAKEAQLTYEIQCELGTERTKYVEYKEYGYNDNFKLQHYYTVQTIPAKTFVNFDVATFTPPEGYVFMSVLPTENGYADQFLASYGQYGASNRIVAMVYNNFTSELTGVFQGYLLFVRSESLPTDTAVATTSLEEGEE